jgi:hypothetical protein
MARSIDAMPPPEIKSARHIASNDSGYSNPFGMKKPSFQWTPMIALSMTQAIRKAPTRVSNPSSSSAPPINSANAAAAIHNHAGRMKENGAGKLVNLAKPGPLKLPKTNCAPWAIKTAAKASRNGTGVHDADVEIILLNIAGRSFRQPEPERALKILRNRGGKGKGKGERVRGKGERGKRSGKAALFYLTLFP